MTPVEKRYLEIKNRFISKYGYEFLRLSEKEQNNLIVSAVQEYGNKLKSRK